MGQAVKQDIKVLMENKPKFLLVHSSSGHKQALKEVLSHPSVSVRLVDTKMSDYRSIQATHRAAHLLLVMVSKFITLIHCVAQYV